MDSYSKIDKTKPDFENSKRAFRKFLRLCGDPRSSAENYLKTTRWKWIKQYHNLYVWRFSLFVKELVIPNTS